MLFSGIITIIEGINISLNVISDYNRYIRVFKLLIYLSTKACTVILLGVLCAYNLLLLKLPSYFIAAAVYKVFIKFPFWLSQNF